MWGDGISKRRGRGCGISHNFAKARRSEPERICKAL